MPVTDPADRPEEAAALEAAAARAMTVGDAAGAVRLLSQALGIAPTVALHLSLAAAQRRLGRLDQALASVERALVLQPRDFTALLMRASLVERLGRTREAAAAYGAALTQAPALEVLNEPTRRAAEHARQVYARHQDDMVEAVQAGSRHALLDCSDAETRRIKAFIADVTRGRRRYRQEPSGFFYPGLAAIDFYERDRFAWLEALEAATDSIEAELADLVCDPTDGFVPYVDYDESLPLDQWRGLNRSPDWSAFHLLFNGQPVAENCARCPKTMEVLSRIPPAATARPLARGHVLCAQTRHPHSAAHRGLEHAAGLPPPAGRAAELPLPSGRGDPDLAARTGLGVRRHGRARGGERQRQGPASS